MVEKWKKIVSKQLSKTNVMDYY